MPNLRAIIILFVSLTLLVIGYVNYQRKTTHIQLYQVHFSAVPAGGYGTLLDPNEREDDESLLRQGVQYHQQEKYDFALMTLRNYLEGNPTSGEPPAELLAATAAAAIGEHETATYFLDQMPRDNSERQHLYHWYRGLIALRGGQTKLAKKHLKKVAEDVGPYQMVAEEILFQFP